MSKIEVNEIVNQSGDNDSGIDLTTNDQIGFKIANASKWTLNSSGNLFPASTSQGIVLGATSDASANRLDDYEEGTWTPNPEGSTTAGTYTNNYREGRYVKIGTIVHISGIVYGGFTGSAGNAYITGLPFSCVNEDTPTLSVQWNNMPFNSLGEEDHQTIGLISGSHIHFRANDRRVNEGHTQCVWANVTINYLRFSGTYRNA